MEGVVFLDSSHETICEAAAAVRQILAQLDATGTTPPAEPARKKRKSRAQKRREHREHEAAAVQETAPEPEPKIGGEATLEAARPQPAATAPIAATQKGRNKRRKARKSPATPCGEYQWGCVGRSVPMAERRFNREQWRAEPHARSEVVGESARVTLDLAMLERTKYPDYHMAEVLPFVAATDHHCGNGVLLVGGVLPKIESGLVHWACAAYEDLQECHP